MGISDYKQFPDRQDWPENGEIEAKWGQLGRGAYNLHSVTYRYGLSLSQIGGIWDGLEEGARLDSWEGVRLPFACLGTSVYVLVS